MGFRNEAHPQTCLTLPLHLKHSSYCASWDPDEKWESGQAGRKQVSDNEKDIDCFVLFFSEKQTKRKKKRQKKM